MPNDPRPRRQSLRLPAYDYSQAGAYFITVCTQNRLMLFGEIIDSDIRLNEMGMIVQQTWDDLPRITIALMWTRSLSFPTTCTELSSWPINPNGTTVSRRSCAASRRSPLAASTNVPASVASCGSV